MLTLFVMFSICGYVTLGIRMFEKLIKKLLGELRIRAKKNEMINILLTQNEVLPIIPTSHLVTHVISY